MKKIFITLLFFIVFSINVYSSPQIINCKEYISKSETTLKINSRIINQLQSSSIVLESLQIGEKLYDLHLVRKKSVISKTSKIFADNSIVSNPEVRTFSGTLNKDETSQVLLTVVNNLLFISIKSKDLSIEILPQYSSNNIYTIQSLESSKFPIINSNDIEEDIEKFADIKGIMKNRLAFDNKMLELELAVETDYEVFKATGSSLEKAQAYTIALYDRVSNLYEQFLNVTLNLTWLKTWTEEPQDPYSAKGDPFILRDKALVYWDVNYKDVKRDCYQVITSIGYGGGGFGYFNALCGNNYYGMSTVSWQGWNDFNNPGFSYDIYITAHELGHNFNAQHTHSCFWNNAPLDTCIVTSENQSCLPDGQIAKPNPGSIMSYCGGINYSSGLGYYTRMVFEPQNIEIMRKYAESVDCLSEYKSQMLELIESEKKSFKAGDSITTNWYSNLINKVNLKYRINKKDAWNLIAENLDAKSLKYTWILPDVCTNKFEVGIFSSELDNLFDIIEHPLTISSTSDEGLVLYFPFDNDTLIDFDDYTFCSYHSLDIKPKQDKDKFSNKKNSILLNGDKIFKIKDFNSKFENLSISFWFKFIEGNDKRNIIGTNWENQPFFESYIWNNMLGFSLYVSGNPVPKQIWHKYYLNPNEWYFTTFVADGKSIKLYLNGTLSESIEIGNYSISQILNPILYLGSRNEVEKYVGNIDELHIYNKALSEINIQELYNINKSNNVIGMLPENNSIISGADIKLSWEKVPNAKKYCMQLIKQKQGIEDEVINLKDIFTNEFTFNDTNYTFFKWRIASYINDTKSEFTNYSNFEYQSSIINETSDLIETYYNSTNGLITFKFESYENPIKGIEIYSILGERVYKYDFDNYISFFQNNIRLNLNIGNYFVLYKGKNKDKISKLTII